MKTTKFFASIWRNEGILAPQLYNLWYTIERNVCGILYFSRWRNYEICRIWIIIHVHNFFPIWSFYNSSRFVSFVELNFVFFMLINSYLWFFLFEMVSFFSKRRYLTREFEWKVTFLGHASEHQLFERPEQMRYS